MPQIGIALFRAEHDNVMVVGSIQAGISMSSALKSHYWATLFCTAVVALTSTVTELDSTVSVKSMVAGWLTSSSAILTWGPKPGAETVMV